MPPSLTDKKSTVQKRFAHVCSAVVSAQALDMVSLCPECTASYSAPAPQEVDILSNCFILARIIKRNLAAMWKLLQRREPRQRKTEAQASVSQSEDWFVSFRTGAVPQPKERVTGNTPRKRFCGCA